MLPTRPTKAALDAAGKLAAVFATASPERRLAFCVDSLGRPTFAMNTLELYVHLTVDDAGTLTWYAVSGGREHFADRVQFDGRSLPAELGSLFALDAV